MRKFILVSLSAALVSGCSVLDRFRPSAGPNAAASDVPAVASEAAAVAPPQNPMVLGQGRSAAALDKTSEAEKAEALAAPAASGERELGKVAVSLGSPAEQGFWLRSPLVSAPGKGRVVTASGQSVAVDLLPGTTGAQLSLAAFRALGLNLTDLPEVTVYAQ